MKQGFILDKKLKKGLSEGTPCKKSIGGICFTKKWRAETSQVSQPGFKFDSFKPQLKSGIFISISWPNRPFFVGLWSGFFLNEGILTYFLTPRSPPNSPILFSVFTSVVYEEDGVLSSYRLLLQNCTASSIFIFNGFCPAISSNWNCWYNESVICPNLSWKRIELYLVGDWWSWHWLLGNFFFPQLFQLLESVKAAITCRVVTRGSYHLPGKPLPHHCQSLNTCLIITSL